MAELVRIIGIDPGLRHTGWGIIESDGVRLSYVSSGTVKPDTDLALSNRLAHIYEELSKTLRIYKPTEAAVEQTFVNRGASATLKLGQARGIALLAPAMAGLGVAEYAPNVVKKSVTGTGHGEKGQIRAMLSYLLPKAKPDSDDAADALAIAITHAHHRHVTGVVLERGNLIVGRLSEAFT
jgi:crossover junction endodeoxyribonuclease RuvC